MAITYIVIYDYMCKFDVEVKNLVKKAEHTHDVEYEQPEKIVSSLRLDLWFFRIVEMGVYIIGPGNKKMYWTDLKRGA